MSEFFNKVKGILDKGVEVSKDAFKTAGEKVQDFGDKSVTRIELKQYEGKIDKKYEELGKKYYEFIKNNPDSNNTDETLASLVGELDVMYNAVKEREEELRKNKL